MADWSLSVPITLSDHWPWFQGHDIFEIECLKIHRASYWPRASGLSRFLLCCYSLTWLSSRALALHVRGDGSNPVSSSFFLLGTQTDWSNYLTWRRTGLSASAELLELPGVQADGCMFVLRLCLGWLISFYDMGIGPKYGPKNLGAPWPRP